MKIFGVMELAGLIFCIAGLGMLIASFSYNGHDFTVLLSLLIWIPIWTVMSYNLAPDGKRTLVVPTRISEPDMIPIGTYQFAIIIFILSFMGSCVLFGFAYEKISDLAFIEMIFLLWPVSAACLSSIRLFIIYVTTYNSHRKRLTSI